VSQPFSVRLITSHPGGTLGYQPLIVRTPLSQVPQLLTHQQILAREQAREVSYINGIPIPNLTILDRGIPD
jgi:hypothetical protein